MEYTLRVCLEMMGDVVPLYLVAETMAVQAASGYGNSPVHGPTLKEMRPLRIAVLVDAARDGRLIVCDQHGQVATAQHLTESSQIPAEWGRDDPKTRDIMALHAKVQHLIAWGESNGDIFHFVDEGVTVTDLVDHEGKVIVAGYYRSYVKWDGYASPAYKLPCIPVAARPRVVSLDDVEAAKSFSKVLGQNPIAEPVRSEESRDERCLRLLGEFESENRHRPFGALSRTAERDGRARQTVKADIDRGQSIRKQQAGPIARMTQTLAR